MNTRTLFAVSALSLLSLGLIEPAQAQVSITDFKPKATEVAIKKSTTLSWTSAGVSTTGSPCTASGAWSGAKPGKATSSSTGNLNTAGVQEFVLTCPGTNGGSATARTTVTVVDVPTLTLSVTDDAVNPGDSVTLTWDSANATSCTASGSWTGAQALDGSLALTNLTKGLKTYTLACKGLAGTVTKKVTVNVVPVAAITSFTATPTSVLQGKSVSLKWATTDATACTASGGWTGTRAKSGSASIGPLSEDSVFELTCTGPGGSDSAEVEVQVLPPPTVDLSLSEETIEPGQSATLLWESENASSCKASGGWSGDKELSGSEAKTEPTKGKKTYTLTCAGSGVSVKDSVTLTVVAAPQLTFTTNFEQVGFEKAATLKWSSTDATVCTASGDWGGDRKTSGSVSTGPLTSGTNTYILTCVGPSGEATETVIVSVLGKPDVTLSLSDSELEVGQSVVVDWSSTDAASCKASGGVTGWAVSDRGLEGSLTFDNLTKGDKIFTLTCTGPGGVTEVKQPLGVDAAPEITEFKASQATGVAPNSAVTLSWKSTDAVECVASGAWATPGKVAVNGSASSASLSKRTNSFTLTCKSKRFEVSDTITVETTIATEVTLTASASTAFVGQSVNLNWTSKDAVKCVGTGGSFAGEKPLQGSGSTGPLEAGTQKFSLRCESTTGAVDEKTVSIEVEAPALSADVGSIEFAAQDLGTTSSVRTVRVTNKGTLSVPLQIGLSGVDVSQFSINSKCSSVLAADASCTIDVKFTPTAIGVKNAELVAASPAAGVSIKILISGVGRSAASQTAFFSAQVRPSVGTIATVAGIGPAQIAGDGGPATAASLRMAYTLVRADDGTLLIHDSSTVRAVDPKTGVITRVAGTGNASFDGDGKLAIDTSFGIVRIRQGADGGGYIRGGFRIRRIDPVTRRVETVVGTGVYGCADGPPSLAKQAKIGSGDFVFDARGNIFLTQYPDETEKCAGVIRRVDAATGVISTLAVTGLPAGFAPTVIAIDPKGNLYTFDDKSFQIFRIDAKPLTDGKFQATAIAGVAGKQGDTGNSGAGDGGPAVAAPLIDVTDIIVNGGGQLFFADNASARIRRVDTAGIISTVAGAGFPLSASSVLPSMPARSGDKTNAIGIPTSLAFDSDGNLLFGEELNDFSIPQSAGFFTYGLVRKLNLQTGEITIVVGRIALPQFAGDGAAAVNASFAIPSGLEFDAAGNLLIGDRLNRRLRRIDVNTGVITSVPGAGDGVNVGTAPTYVTTDAAGNAYYADRSNRVRKVDAATGAVTVIAGLSSGQAGFTPDGAAANSSPIRGPLGVATDGSGNVYFVENGNARIRKISNTGVLSTVAGIGYPAAGAPTPPLGDGGAATSAYLPSVVDVAHYNGKLYFTDAASTPTGLAGLVREINLADGKIRRIAGNGQSGAPSRSGLATESPLGQLFGLAVDSAGNVVFADVSSQSLMRVDAVTGQISRVVGGQLGFAGDGGPANGAAINVPQGLAFDRRGNLVFADRANNRIRAAFCVGAPAQGEVSQCDSNASVSGIKRVLISWNQPGATNCIASGSPAFSGPRASSGAEWVALPVSGGANNFTLQCTTASGTTIQRIEVNAATGAASTSVVQAALRLSSSALVFPATIVGVPSPSQTLTVANSGTAPVTINSVGIIEPPPVGQFVLANNCAGVALQPGANCQISVVFKPFGGNAIGAIALGISGSSSPMLVPMSGFGIDAQATQTRFFNATTSPVAGVIATAAGSGPERVAGDGGPATGLAIASFGSIAVPGVIAADDAYYFTDGVEIRAIDRSGSRGVVKIAGNGQPYFDGDGKVGLETGINARKLIPGPGEENAGYFIQGNRIRRISGDTPNTVTTVVNTSGVTGTAGDGGQATAATLDAPADIVFDSSGRLYIADYNAGRIRVVDPGTKVITSVTLSGAPSSFKPLQMTIDSSNRLYVFDDASKKIYRITPSSGEVTAIAGTGTVGQSGDGGAAPQATLGAISSMLVTPSGQLLLADSQNLKIRAIDLTTGIITTVAGKGPSTAQPFGELLDASRLQATMPAADGQAIGIPGSLSLDLLDGKTVIVGETVQDFSAGLAGQGFSFAGIIRRLDLTTRTLTLAAGRGHFATFAGDGGPAVTAKLRVPTGIEFDTDGNLYIGDRLNGRLRRVDAVTGVIDSVFVDSTRPSWSSDNSIAGTRAPSYVATDTAGNVYYVEWRGNRVMRWNKASKTVQVIAGTGTSGFAGDGGPATSAPLQAPLGIAVDTAGNVYVAVTGRIRRVAPDGTITTIAGVGSTSSAGSNVGLGDGGPAISAIIAPHELAVRDNKLYFTDEGSATVRMIDLGTGIVTRIAGNGTAGASPFSGVALNSPLGQLWGLAVSSAGQVFFGEANSNRVLRIEPSTGQIFRSLGGVRGFGGDGALANGSAINTPQGIAIDRRGNVFFADRSNNRVRVALCFAAPEVGQVSDCSVLSTAGARRVLVSWSQPGAFNCIAGGAWAGPRPSQGAEWLAPAVNGKNRYTLTCNTSPTAKFTVESEVDTTAVTTQAFDPAEDSKTSKTPGASTTPTVSVPTQSLFIGRSAVSGGDSAAAGDAGDSEAGAASASTTATTAVASATDSNTGSRYVVLGGTADAAGLQPWRIEYRDSADAVIAARELRSTAEVIWRSADGTGRALPTTTQVAVCANQVWTAQDGYQLGFGGSDLGLQGRWQSETSIGGGAEATLISGISCANGGVSVSGYSFGVSAEGPGLTRGLLDATAFDIVLDARGAEVSRDLRAVKVTMPEVCSAASANGGLKRFCEAWNKAAPGSP